MTLLLLLRGSSTTTSTPSSFRNFLPISLNDEGLIRGAARIMYADVTQAMPTQIADVINLSTYQSQAGWTDLGATKTGIQISYNTVGEDVFDIDINGDVYTYPDMWAMDISTSLAELTLDRMAFAWEQTTVAVVAKTGGNEKQTNFGTSLNLRKRKLAVLFQRPNKKIRAFIFTRVIIVSQNATLNYAKIGDQQTLPVKFRCLPDMSIAEPTARFALIADQQ